MKKVLIFSAVLLGSVLAYSEADAQFTRPRRPGETTGTGNTGTGNTGTGTTTTTTTNTGGGGGLRPEKRFDTARTEGGSKEYGGTVKRSMRAEFGYDTKNTQVADRTPLAYEHLREEDVVFSHFIWREIDAREKMNRVFSYPGRDNVGDQRFFAILLDALKYDSVWAFSAEDDRFTTPMSYDEIMAQVTQRGTELDTLYVPNLNDENVYDTVIQWRANPFAPKPDSIYTFRIKEQVMFDKESSRLFTRILGIAPVAKIGAAPGVPNAQAVSKTLFWVYYPDLRPKLAKSFAYNPKNASGRMTWEDLFESRYFSSYIVKSTLDNTSDRTLRELIKDPLFRLLEGENIKEKIFNYEQNLWSY